MSVFLSIAAIASNIGLLGTSAYLITRAAQQPSIADLQVAIVGVRFFGLLRGIARYFERLVSHSVNFQLLGSLRAWFYEKLEPLAPARTQLSSSGDLLNQAVGDIETLQEFYLRVVAPAVSAALITGGMGVFVGLYDPILAVVLLTGLALSGIALPIIAKVISAKIMSDLVVRRGIFSAKFSRFVQGLADILVLDVQAQKRGELLSEARILELLQKKSAWRTALINSINILMTNLTFWLIILVAIPQVQSGRLDGISLVVISLASLASFEAVVSLGPASQSLQQVLPAASRIFSLVDQKPTVMEPTHPRKIDGHPDLVINNLTFTYPGKDSAALNQVSLSLPYGKKIALVGEPGSGKSTIFWLLERFWDCPAGAINLGGVDIREIGQLQVRSLFNLFEQSAPVFAGTIRANLLAGYQDASEAQMIDGLNKSGLGNWLKTLPDGLDTWVGERGSQVSGGEKQRIALARFFLRDSPILLLDEPFTNLDPENKNHIAEAIIEKSQGRSLILATHSYEFLDLVDEILVIRNGEIVEKGSLVELVSQKGEFVRLQGTGG